MGGCIPLILPLWIRPLAISYRNHQKSLAYFCHLASLVFVFCTKRQSQKRGGMVQIPLSTIPKRLTNSLLTFFQLRYKPILLYPIQRKKNHSNYLKNLCDNVQHAKFQLGNERSWYCSNLGLGACCNVIKANLNNKMGSSTGTCGIYIHLKLFIC